MRVKLETAKLAKELGYNEKTLGVFAIGVNGQIGEYSEDWILGNHKLCENIIADWNNFPMQKKDSKEYISMPTQSELQKWLRDKKNIHIGIAPRYISAEDIGGQVKLTWNNGFSNATKEHTNYEECLEEALVLGLTRLKEISENGRSKTE